MQLRPLVLALLAATGCVASSDSDIEIDTDETSNPADPKTLGDDDRGAVPERLAGDSAITTLSGIDAGGRAFGISVTALAIPLIPATPDTDVANPDSVLELPANDIVNDAVLHVDTDADIELSSASSSSNAAVNDLSLTVGLISVSARTVAVHASATANSAQSGTSTAGSTVQDLVINGVKYGNINQPLNIDLVGLGAVQVLAAEHTDGAVSINGIRVVVYDLPLTPIDESTEVVVSHADAFATYPQGPQ